MNDGVKLACPEEETAMLSRNGISNDIIEPVSTIHSEPVTSIGSTSDIVLHMQNHGKYAKNLQGTA